MITAQAIDKAIDAHSLWKSRLKEAINKRDSEFKVQNVKLDNFCEFGKWLYSLPSDIKSTDAFQNIRNLHAEFHGVASEILDLALIGRKEDAMKKLDFGGPYSLISGKLTLALNRWKEANC